MFVCFINNENLYLLKENFDVGYGHFLAERSRQMEWLSPKQQVSAPPQKAGNIMISNYCVPSQTRMHFVKF